MGPLPISNHKFYTCGKHIRKCMLHQLMFRYLLCFLDMERKFSLLMRIIRTAGSQRKFSYSFGPCVAWTRPCFISGRALAVAKNSLAKKNLLKESLILMESQFSSVQFSRPVMSDSLWLHRLQHVRLPCPSPTPGARSNSCSSSQWRHPTISSSVVPFSSCLQSFLASWSWK